MFLASREPPLHVRSTTAMTRPLFRGSLASLSLALLLGACGTDKATGPSVVIFANNPCSVTGTLTLAEAQAMRVDCGNGGTTLTLAGGGASYLVVPQFATDQVANQ